MRKILMISLMVLSAVVGMNAQKVAVIDMDYILKAIPQYESANDQLNQLSTKWQKEVEAIQTEVQTMYKNYQTEFVFLTPEMKKQRETTLLPKNAK